MNPKTPDKRSSAHAATSAKQRNKNHSASPRLRVKQFPRKPRSDSPLNLLSDDRQAALIEFLTDHPLREAVQQLAAEGVQTTESALSRFRAAYALRLDDGPEQAAIEFLAQPSQKPGEILSREELFERGQYKLMARAILNNDHKAWCSLHRARQQEERFKQNVEWRKLEERRVVLVEQQAEIEAAERDHRAILERDRLSAIARQLPLWAEAEAKKNEPKVTTIEEVEASVRKSFGLSPKPPARPQSPPPASNKSQPASAPTQPTAPFAAPSAAHHTSHVTHHSEQPTTDKQQLPPQSSEPVPQLGCRVGSHAIEESPLLPHVFPPVIPSTKPLDEMEEIGEMLRTYGTVGDKFLMLTGEALELYSKKNLFLPRPIHPWFSLTPAIVRAAIKNLRNGLL